MKYEVFPIKMVDNLSIFLVCGEVEALRALLAAGSDITITDLNGGSPVCNKIGKPEKKIVTSNRYIFKRFIQFLVTIIIFLSVCLSHFISYIMQHK